MTLTWLRLPQAWHWGGLSFKELAIRTYEAVDKHETIDRAAIVAFYAMLALAPFLGLVLTITLGGFGRGRHRPDPEPVGAVPPAGDGRDRTRRAGRDPGDPAGRHYVGVIPGPALVGIQRLRRGHGIHQRRLRCP